MTTENAGEGLWLRLWRFVREQTALAVMVTVIMLGVLAAAFFAGRATDAYDSAEAYRQGRSDGFIAAMDGRNLNRLPTDSSTLPWQRVTLVAVGNCSEPKATFMVRVGGLVPNGKYLITTSRQPVNITAAPGTTLGKADDIGNATFYFNCYSREDVLLQQGDYEIRVTDEKTRANGFTHVTVVLRRK